MVSSVVAESDQVWVEGYTTSSGRQVEGYFRRRHTGAGFDDGEGRGVIAPDRSVQRYAAAAPATTAPTHPAATSTTGGMRGAGQRVASNTAPAVSEAQQEAQTGRGPGEDTGHRCALCGQFADAAHHCPARPEGLPAANYAGMGAGSRVEQMLADLDASVKAIVESGQLQAWLDAMSSNGLNRWSANNRMLAIMQLLSRDEPVEDIHLMGFKQWGEHERQVNKGAKAVWILAPVTRRFTTIDPDGTETDERRVVGFKAVPVFNITDTHGKPMPGAPIHVTEGAATPGTLQGLQERVERAGYSYSEETIPGCQPATGQGTLGYTEPATKRIVVDGRLSPVMKSSTIAHELGHVHCGHVNGAPGEYQRHRGRMETEAEMTAYLVNRSRGMSRAQVDSFSPGYIAGWSKGDPTTMRASVDKAVKAYNTIMDGDWPR